MTSLLTFHKTGNIRDGKSEGEKKDKYYFRLAKGQQTTFARILQEREYFGPYIIASIEVNPHLLHHDEEKKMNEQILYRNEKFTRVS